MDDARREKTVEAMIDSDLDAGEAPPPDASGLWSPSRRSLTAGLILTVTLFAAESLAVITILPLVANDLGGLALYGFVTSAFFLGTLVGIVIGGREADRRGPGSVYLGGLALFTAGLLLCGSATSMIVVVIGRAIQGLGAGTIPSIEYAVIGRAYPERVRPRMFALLSTAWVAPGLIGPSVSALVAERASWRLIFLGIVPLVVLAALLCGRALWSFSPLPAGDQVPHRIADVLRVAAGTGCVLAGLERREPWLALGLLLLGCVIGVGPLRRLLPPGTVRARSGLPVVVLTRGLLTFAFFGADAFVPLLITSVRGQSAAAAGIAVTGATMAWTAGTWTQERLAVRWSSRRMVVMGLGFLVLGIMGVGSGLSAALPLWVPIVAWGIGGFGMGLAYPCLSVLLLSEGPPESRGHAAASFNLADNLGVALGAGAGGAAVAWGAATTWSSRGGLAVTFATMALVGAIALLVATRLPSRTVPRT